MLSFLIDENLPRILMQVLRQRGYKARHILDLLPQGSSDPKIYALAQQSQSILVSRDVEFGNVLLYPPGTHFGIVVIRFPSTVPIETLLTEIPAAIGSLHESELQGSLLILEPGRTRIRTGRPDF